ncbi:hypothetical protein GXP70_18070 [Paenibacillus lycopersici]|uniref:Uncharacterized protein n=1 Tax=Paenibacillus lycopersici TaxID=2704462 RepID=A0A6C0G1Z9_9BACL|nr:hypothetical protein [Paenibacillus lycopersici]QHT61691.1 hypothetical protein GXP70_18070 [Paenibacillus lycopersici]
MASLLTKDPVTGLNKLQQAQVDARQAAGQAAPSYAANPATPTFVTSTPAPSTTGTPNFTTAGAGVLPAVSAASKPATPTFVKTPTTPTTPSTTGTPTFTPSTSSPLAKDPVTGLNQFQATQKANQAITAAGGTPSYVAEVSAPSKPATPTFVTTPSTPSTNPTIPKLVYNEASQTNYGGKGDPLNEILYSKKQYDAGNTAWAAQNAQQFYAQLSPEEAAAVKNMNTQQLIDYINNKNTGTSKTPTTPNFVPSTPTQTSTPTPAAVPGTGNMPVFTGPAKSDVPTVDQYKPAIPVMDEAAIRKYAEDQTARKLSDARLTADQAIANSQLTAKQQSDALKGNFDKMYETINEDRSTEDVQNQRRLSPFSGRSDYALGMIEQNRARTDRENQSSLQTNQANIAAQAAQLQQQINDKYTALANAAPDEREALFQSIKNDERNYDLMVHGQLTQDALTNSQLGNTAFNQALQQFQTNYQVGQDQIHNDAQYAGTYNGQQTVQQQQQQIQNDAIYGGTYNGGQSLQGQQQALADKNANWGAYMDMVNQTGNLGKGPTQTWGNLVNNANAGAQTMAGQQNQLNQTQVMAQLTGTLPNGQKTTAEQQRQLQNLWQQADMTGTIPDQLATIYGIPKGTQTQAAKQWAMSYSLQQDQFQSGVDQDIYKLQQQQNQQQQSQTQAGPTSADISKAINSSPLLQGSKDQYGNPIPVNFADPAVQKQIEAMIITQTQDPIVAVQLYNMYGIPVPDELTKEYKAALAAGKPAK